MRVADVMWKDVEWIEPHTSMEEVAMRMRENPYSCLVVCQDGFPVGMITDQDLAEVLAAILGGRTAPRLAADAMGTPVATVDADASISLAAGECRARHVHRLAVLDADRQLVGLVGRADLLSARVQEIEHRCLELERAAEIRRVELERARDALHDAALVDEQLGIGNGTAMRFALERAHAAALRYRRPYAVALVDVDRFRLYNERHGAGRADTTLRRVAQQLCGAIRRADSLYRLQGDRMLALMPETHADGAAGLTERMRSEVEALAIPLDGPDDPLTVSVGWAAWNPGRPQVSAEALVERAGQALARAKEDGRNRVAHARDEA